MTHVTITTNTFSLLSILSNVAFGFVETATESHVMSYISTEKGLERALEQTSRFYTDLEHIAMDLGTLTQRYSQSQSSVSKCHHRSIDALDWDWHDDAQSPKSVHRKQQQQHHSLSLTLSTNKSKVRRKLSTRMNQTDYNESDQRSFDCTTSPLRRSKTHGMNRSIVSHGSRSSCV